MNRTDELLNKYIDNELNENELNEFNQLLEVEENVKKLKALQLTHQSLQKLEYENAPAGFTEKFMVFLRENTAVKIPKNYFAIAINSIFIIMIVGILAFLISSIHWTTSSGNSGAQVTNILNNVNNFIPSALSFFSNKTVVFYSAFTCLLLLIGVYFIVDAHKAFKKKIEKFTVR